MTQDPVLMQAMIQKMDWHEKRQKTLAENIANADTPKAVPYDVKSPDFKHLLQQTTSPRSLAGAAVQTPSVATTNEKHMTAGSSASAEGRVKETKQKETYEVAPAGNAIVLEEQLLKMNENAADHRLISNLYQKNYEMLKTSIK